jgi:dihydroorotate dehydrogenase (fumarate)
MSVDMSTTYLGLRLANPLVPSASTLGSRIDTLWRLRDAGAAAVVMPSLFEEQIEHDERELDRLLDTGRESNPEATTYFPELADYNTGPDEHLRHLELTKKELGLPVIGSLNGTTEGGWLRYARLIEDAGADALELNVYLVASDPAVTGAEVEQRIVDLVAAVRSRIRIPFAVKLAPSFSSLPNLAARLVDAGADGLVLFNRLLNPDIELETLAVEPTLHLSSSEEVRLPLRWIAILRGQVDASLAATTGVHTWEDAVKVILAGADVAMVASTLYRNGPEHLATIVEGVRSWLEERGYDSVEQAKGSLCRLNAPDPGAFERANYVRALTRYSSPYDWRGAPTSNRA